MGENRNANDGEGEFRNANDGAGENQNANDGAEKVNMRLLRGTLCDGSIARRGQKVLMGCAGPVGTRDGLANISTRGVKRKDVRHAESRRPPA